MKYLLGANTLGGSVDVSMTKKKKFYNINTRCRCKIFSSLTLRSPTRVEFLKGLIRKTQTLLITVVKGQTQLLFAASVIYEENVFYNIRHQGPML